jgi:leucyl aminopeptidase
MKFEFSANPLDKISSDAAVVFALADESSKKTSYIPLSGFVELDTVLKGQLSKIASIEKFSGKRGETLKVYPNVSVLPTKIVIIGLGNKSEFIADDLRRVMGSLAGRMKHKIDSVSLVLPADTMLGMDTDLAMRVVVEGLLLGSYEFGKYKKADKEAREFSAIIISERKKANHTKLRAAAEKADLYYQATKLARDLINEQAAVATPTLLADLAKDIAKSSPEITVKVFDKEAVEKMGMEAFLGIARASDTPPKFIYLTYTPKGKKAKRKLAVVGKGITFDSGGINVKPGDHMQDMKMDMSGAAAVLGVFSVIAELKPDFTVMGLIAATPNMISGKSIVPGDVVRAMNGKTIEVLNTDAEGRVTMADSLSFAVKEGATEIIDFATLTGACVVALGEEIAGLFPNNRDLTEKVKAAAHDAGEKVWEMPMDRDYKKMNKSSIADVANIGSSRYGGAITAGLFLEEFVDKTPFVHIDIAGPAFTNRGNDISPKGGTGFGVRTVLNLVAEKEVK